MNIAGINFFNINTPYKAKIARGFLYPNLAPLASDTVSFTGARTRKKEEPESIIKPKAKPKLDQTERGSYHNASKIYSESEYAYGQLKYILSYTFNTKVIDADSENFEQELDREIENNKGCPVLFISARRKSPASISEKMGSAFPHVKGKNATKEALNDIIGARIVIAADGTNFKEGDYVLDKLTEAVKKGRLRIKKVVNHGQDNNKLNYATSAKINKLVATARKNGEPLCAYSDSPRDSGYLAIHIITGEIADGYNAEIQIMGYDVQKFKEVEDLCYKALLDKHVPKKYESVNKAFEPLRNNKNLLDDYMEYTKRAYRYERMKSFDKKPHDNNEFLKIPDDLNIPKKLDFNNIKKMMDAADNASRKQKSGG